MASPWRWLLSKDLNMRDQILLVSGAKALAVDQPLRWVLLNESFLFPRTGTYKAAIITISMLRTRRL